MSPLSRPLRLASLTFSNLLTPIAVLVFATGFFPYKPVLPGLAVWDYVEKSGVSGDVGAVGTVNAPFDKVIFMVVDALRSDFVYGEGSGMGFTQRYVRRWCGQDRRTQCHAGER
jgi:ethanolaminephosphotransferase